jgi:uncharacterized membrane protein YheB (UPF0754 family)
VFTKHVFPNLVALIIIGLSFALPAPSKGVLLSVGLFALSGALTNWLAIHMLFNRVPGLYGSGVIVLRFEEFKQSILTLVHQHLFTRERVDGAMNTTNISNIDLQPLFAKLNLDAAYDQLVATIMDSSFGGMLGMVGGVGALEPMREPFKKRMNKFLVEAAESPRFQQAVNEQIQQFTSSDDFLLKLDRILQARLDELTPEMVRDIMHRIIHKHLGWLVVWGGVFGGIIGLIAGLIPLYV